LALVPRPLASKQFAFAIERTCAKSFRLIQKLYHAAGLRLLYNAGRDVLRSVWDSDCERFLMIF